MILNGREVRFRRTVWATIAVAALCPNRDLNRIAEVIGGDFVDSGLAMANFIRVMSEGYEKSEHFKDPAYEEHPVTVDELMALDDWELFTALFAEAVRSWQDDGKTTVETAPPKKGGKKKSQPSG